MKAWIVRPKDDCCATVVFAETRGKARALAQHTDCCCDVDFIDIEVRRVPHMDKYYKKGKTVMGWNSSQDRVALVKDCDFVCVDKTFDEDCEQCPAKEYCYIYTDYIAEKGGD